MRYLVSLVLLVFISCGQPEPRKPIQVKSTSFYKTSVERSKKLLEKEERLIAATIKKDTAHQYTTSSTGVWYTIWEPNTTDEYTPHTDDLVTLTYAVLSLTNDTIYSAKEIGTVKYKVDKQKLFPGLRNGVKLLKENETATFLFPSSLAYGYHGDKDKIGTNTPLKTILTVQKIESASDSIL